jgi:hypothetical protein
MSHSAKRARHTVHRQSLLCRVLFLGHSAKRFAECQTALGKEKQSLRRWVTETASLPSVPGDTRQRSYLCRVPTRQHSAKNPPERVPMSGSLPSAWHGTRQSVFFCRVLRTLHSAKNLYRCPGLGSLPSAWHGTRQSVLLCRVSMTLHSAKNLYRCPGLGSLPSAMVWTLGKAPLCRVLHSTK